MKWRQWHRMPGTSGPLDNGQPLTPSWIVFVHRKLAVEMLVGRKSPFARHADLLPFITELAVELDGIELNHPAPESGPGPLTSSVTTVTMFNDGPLDPPNAPLSAATVRVGNSLLNARVPQKKTYSETQRIPCNDA